MRTVLIASIVALGAAVYAAQGEGPARAEKSKADVLCRAVTEKGVRCTGKKAGGSDYCRRHAVDRKPARPVKRCRAIGWDGKQCDRAPQTNRCYCVQHLKPGAVAAPESARKSAPEAVTTATPKAR